MFHGVYKNIIVLIVLCKPGGVFGSANNNTCIFRRGFCTSVLLINPRRACAARVTVVVLCGCVCVFVCPGRSSATHVTKRHTRHTHGLGILLAPELIWRFSYNGFVSKIAIAFPYFDRTVVGHFFNAKLAHFLHSFRILRS